jgi:hypothetical protein
MNKTVLIEATVVGIIFLFITSIIMIGLHYMFPNDYTGCLYLPNKSSFKYYAATFLSGFIVHLLCECLGVNKWYCKNGNACIK